MDDVNSSGVQTRRKKKARLSKEQENDFGCWASFLGDENEGRPRSAPKLVTEHDALVFFKWFLGTEEQKTAA